MAAWNRAAAISNGRAGGEAALFARSNSLGMEGDAVERRIWAAESEGCNAPSHDHRRISLVLADDEATEMQ